MIQVANGEILRNLLRVAFHPMLVSLVLWTGIRVPLIITSGFRDNDRGVHGTDPCRGLDIRSHHLKDPSALCDEINMKWIYDPKRPHMKCALFHDVGLGAHIHLQVHPNTIFKEVEDV